MLPAVDDHPACRQQFGSGSCQMHERERRGYRVVTLRQPEVTAGEQVVPVAIADDGHILGTVPVEAEAPGGVQIGGSGSVPATVPFGGGAA